MPHMAPMWWVVLYASMIMMFVSMMIKLFYTMPPSTKPSLLTSSKSELTWMW